MCEISVIIPVYNVEKYLKECLDSVVNQSFTDLEIICVNDGSADKSSDILEEYSKKDSRIKIITQKNQGLGASRNNGLNLAKGKYVYFIDSDDYINPDTLEKLHESIESNRSDVVLFKFKTFDDARNVHNRGSEFRIDKIFGDRDYSDFTFTYNEVKKHVLNTAFSACLKLYSKDFLDSYDDFRFPENISYEDVVFHVKVMTRASRISFVNESMYHYRSNPDSISNLKSNGFDIFEVIDMVEDFLRQDDYYDILENEFALFKISQILTYLKSTKSEEFFQKAKNEFESFKINDMNFIKPKFEEYNMVLESDSYLDYISNYYLIQISKLEKENEKLRIENKELKQINHGMRHSRSWKLTKPLRFLKNYRK